MDVNAFRRVAEKFTEHCAYHFYDRCEQKPKDFDTAKGFLDYFKKWLDTMSEEYCDDFDHVLDHFDEVEVEKIDDDTYIPVIGDLNSTAHCT